MHTEYWGEIVEYAQAIKSLRDVKGERITTGIGHILERDRDIRPGFSYTWVRSSIPREGDEITRYEVSDLEVKLFNLPEETEDLYHLVPPEYKISSEEARLIFAVKNALSEQYPRDMDLSRSEQVKRYIMSRGRKLLKKTAERLDISLGDGRDEELKRVEELGSILAKYTAGYGILETFLEDPHVEDIYVDAPAVKNNVYVELTGIDGIREKCRTNVYLSDKDMESILSRFRAESGKPFSEAFPVLETDLSQYETRVTAIGRPLSPDGMALALRRRGKDIWTLPKLIEVGSLTPTAAGLISFLIDGRSTILVAGSRGAGKTSLLGAMMLEFPKSQRILTIEDTRELPSKKMQELEYNVQSMTVHSLLEEGGMSADDALRVSLRLGESSIILGEVRGEEAKTLYEAMRAGTAGSAVMGTIHGDSPISVYERVVHDMGISKESFSATDIVVIAGIVRPGGMQKRLRRVTHVSEYQEEDFTDLMNFEEELGPTEYLRRNSKKIGEIARSWGLTYEEAIDNIQLRSYMREMMVEKAKEKGERLISPSWVSRCNDKFWNLIEKHGGGRTEKVKEDWTKWYEKRVDYE